MADESDEDDYVFYGTVLHDEGEQPSIGASRVQDPAQLRSLPVHQQEARDEQGRKRFHGAFTGGYSAGYYNTVGSKEGWQPSTFESSRSAPAEHKQQNIEDFLDEDELEERNKSSLQLKTTYDTFGTTAADLAHSQAAEAAASRPSVIPGAVPLEFFAPVSSSIGMQLLQKMGWRPGRGLGSTSTTANDADSSSKWGTISGVSIENTPMYVLDPKVDLHGLGFDPFEGAEEFRKLKRQKLADSRAQAGVLGTAGSAGFEGLGGSGSRQQQKGRGVAFGTGALEETDTLGYMEDYVDHGTDVMAKKGQRQEIYTYEEASESDDEDRFNPRRETPVAARLAAAQHDSMLYLTGKEQYTQHGSFIPGFRAARQLMQFPEYPPPEVPASFVAFHSFEPAAAAAAGQSAVSSFEAAKAAASAAAAAAAGIPGAAAAKAVAAAAAAAAVSGKALRQPPFAAAGDSNASNSAGAAVGEPSTDPVPPPGDAALARQIDGLAAQVVRSGQLVEQLAKQQASRQPGKYQFVLGGEGHKYYHWKLQQLRAAGAAGAAVAAATTQHRGAAASPAQPDGHTGTRVNGAGAAGQPVVLVARRKGPLNVQDRMALLGETPLPSSSAAAATAGSNEQGAAGAAAPRPLLGAVASGDQQRLAAALNSAFVRGTVQDMGDAYQKQQEAVAGLRNPKLEQQQRWRQQGQGVTIHDEASSLSALPAAAMGSGDAAAADDAAAAATAAKAAELPVRTFEDWRPAPLLCKRFNVPDPYKGRAAPVEMPKFKSDYLALPDTAAAVAAMAAAEEQRLQQQWQQQQGSASEAAMGAGHDPTAFLDDIMQDIAQQDAISEAAEAAAAAAAQSKAASQADPSTQQAAQAGVQAVPKAATPPAAVSARAAGTDATTTETSSAAAGGKEAVAIEPPLLEKPMDLFKAIFEHESESEGEEDADNDQNARQIPQGKLAPAAGREAATGAVVQQQQQQDGRHPVRAGSTGHAIGHAAKGLADAFMRSGQAATAANGAAGITITPGQQQKQEILAALEALRSKGSMKQKKQKRKKKHKKESKSSKHKKHSKNSKRKKSPKRKRRKESRGSGSSSDSDSSSEGSSGTSSRGTL